MYLSHALTLLCLTATIHGRSDTYAANCDAPPPKGGYKAPDFPTMKKVLQVAFNDACSLASFAYPIAQNLESAKDSTQYNHYFDSTYPAAQQMANHVYNMTLAVAEGNVGTTPRWNVNFDCAGTLTGCKGSPASLAVTTATVGGTLVEICPLFWTARSTAFVLPGNEPDPDAILSKPYRDRTTSGWCNPNQPANFFATAGHTILHELTHLDKIGEMAGLEANDNGEHGTDDYQIEKADKNDPDKVVDGCQLRGARRYLQRWEKTKDDEDKAIASPDYNAESIAGFSTEYFFSTQCTNLGDIPEGDKD